MMRRIFPLLIATAVSLPAQAADWQNVASEKGARVDIDRASLLPSDPGKKIVWMRLVMAPEDAAREGYHTLKALNRYDCRANRYSTIKRVYLREDMTVMREERVEGERESSVQAGTTDAKLFREVCQPPTVERPEEGRDAGGRGRTEGRQGRRKGCQGRQRGEEAAG